VYLLAGTDLHAENIIACGDHPVLIDLETLIHPFLRDDDLPADFESRANRQLWNSVLRSDLLPRWQVGSDAGSYDFSGFGAREEQVTAHQLPCWSNVNTDRMVLGCQPERIVTNRNIATLHQQNLRVEDYSDALLSGFGAMYTLLQQNRQALQAGPLRGFAHQTTRFVFRPTKVYGLVLRKSLDPQLMRDGCLRSMFLDVLSRVFLSSDTRPRLWPLVKLEEQAIQELDIPFFTARSDSNHLPCGLDCEIAECLEEPGFDLVTARLKQLGHRDLERQKHLIRASLYCRSATLICSSHFTAADVHPKDRVPVTLTVDREILLKQATAIGHQIVDQSLPLADGSVTWIAPRYLPDIQVMQLRAVDFGLYEGSSGIAFFLGALASLQPGCLQPDFLDAAIKPLRREAFELTDMGRDISLGGAVGCGSVLYALSHLSQWRENPDLLNAASEFAAQMTLELIRRDHSYDIVNGVAGTILGLLALHRRNCDPSVLAIAEACGHHLLASRISSTGGNRAWATLEGKMLTGFSHGAAGIAYALLCLYRVTLADEYKRAAEEAIAYEDSVFVPERGNWPDLRPGNDGFSPGFRCSWCHGAPGIGMARLATLDVLDNPTVRRDIEVAIQTTQQADLQEENSLCCGNLGRLEFLSMAALVLSRPALRGWVDGRIAQLAYQLTTCAADSARSTFNPGLFQGSAGLGYQLLRFVWPGRLPSVLLWE
jgi:type 2 lantibiotic biosynthesis protein LanM